MMKFFKSIIVLSFCLVVHAKEREECAVVDINTNDIELLSSHVMRFCYISFVKVRGEKYLVKQKRFLHKLLGAARDGFTAWIAQPLDIAHRVDIIPSGRKFPGKKNVEWPATIHTIAPGKVINGFKGKECPYSHIKMQQGDVGITRYMIASMAFHIQLAIIAALDTFVCNQDRHKGNLFYKPSTDSFCAIDMDSAYKYNLTQLSYVTLKKILQDVSHYSSHEKKALFQYRKTLKFLYDTYSLSELLDKYDYFLKKAGFVEGSEFYPDKLQKLVKHNKRIMVDNYPYVKKIIDLLDDFLDKVKKSYKNDHPRLAQLVKNRALSE